MKEFFVWYKPTIAAGDYCQYGVHDVRQITLDYSVELNGSFNQGFESKEDAVKALIAFKTRYEFNYQANGEFILVSSYRTVE